MKIYANGQFKIMRIKRGFTVVALAKAVGLTKQAIGQIERRANGVSPEKSVEILRVLGLDFDDVFELVEREVI